jgi:hypothetical protein
MAAHTIAMLTLVLILVVSKASAEAQEDDGALACWWNYASCATESYGDQNWRSICYADFSRCLSTRTIPNCPAGGEVEECSAVFRDCTELADGDAELNQQCAEDMDACLFAHGC